MLLLLDQGEDPEKEGQKADDPDQTKGHHQFGAVQGSSLRLGLLFGLQGSFFRDAFFRPRAFCSSRLTQPERVKPLRAEWLLAVLARPGWR